MTSLQLIQKVFNMEMGDRIPFCPAIYEHKGFLIGKTPSEVCRSKDLLVKSLFAEYERYASDFLTVGIDVYNVEAEAIGCEITYFDDSPDMPGVGSHPVQKIDDLEKLDLPNPARDGRMPLILDAASEVDNKLGDRIKIFGAVTGPFSLATELVGMENFMVATMMDPEFSMSVLKYSSEVSVEFGKAFIALGIDPVIFDSRVMPPLCSPDYFREVVSRLYQRNIIPELKDAGARNIALIIGGNTTPILEAMIETQATQILCDFGSDIELFKTKCLQHNIPLRVNLDSRLLHKGPVEKIHEHTMNIIGKCRNHPGLILGTGVVAYDCPPEHIAAVRECLE